MRATVCYKLVVLELLLLIFCMCCFGPCLVNVYARCDKPMMTKPTTTRANPAAEYRRTSGGALHWLVYDVGPAAGHTLEFTTP